MFKLLISGRADDISGLDRNATSVNIWKDLCASQVAEI